MPSARCWSMLYPLEIPRCHQNEVTGTSIASFVVEKNGAISNIKIVRDIGGGTGEETARVLRQMQRMAFADPW